MPILPNIFPNAAADLVRIGEAKTSHEAFGKTDEPFDHLMTRALSPFSSKEISPVAEENPPTKIILPDLGKRNVSLNKSAQSFPILRTVVENSSQVETDPVDFPLSSKNSKSGAPASDKSDLKKAGSNPAVAANASKPPAIPGENVLAQTLAPIVTKTDQKPGENQTKTTDGNSDLAENLSIPSEVKIAAVIPENILIPIPTPTIVMPDRRNELSAKAASSVGVATLKTTAAGKPSEKISTAPSEVKKFSAADTTVSNLTVPKNQPGTDANPIVKTGNQEKITAAVEALAVEKTSSIDSKPATLAATSPQILPLTKNTADDLSLSKIVIQSFAQSPQPEFSASTDLNAKSATPKESAVNGTSVAQQDVPMTQTEKPNKTADSAGKILPGAAVAVARENNLPPRENFSAQTFARAGQMTANVTANSAPSNNPTDVAPLSADSTNSIASANVSDARSRALERVQDMVVLHATRLSESGNDLLQVVIKPGAGTQLSLELRQRGDGVEATATLQRGDFEHLNQQWPALQQQLEQRGIRLAPLVADGNFAGSGENNFQQKQNQFAESDSFPTFAEVAPVDSFAQPAARAGAHRGWETWA
jgi:hypothetical protein